MSIERWRVVWAWVFILGEWGYYQKTQNEEEVEDNRSFVDLQIGVDTQFSKFSQSVCWGTYVCDKGFYGSS